MEFTENIKKRKPLTVSVVMDPYLIDFIDECADLQSRSRSNMMVQIVKYYKAAQKEAQRT